ncbi:Gti1/Pac2 family domain containing protein [Rhypophila decipiens]
MANHAPQLLETYHGSVKTPADAIKLFEACRIGMLPRVQRRLSEKERGLITSGSVFVWDEKEAGMRRWTDGKSWSASRVSGSFLTYREMEGKRSSGFGGGRRTAGRSPDSARGDSDENQDDGGEPEPEGYRYKQDGLMKQSYSLTTTQGQHLHLISYYRRSDTTLTEPTKDPNLRNVTPPSNLYKEPNLEPSGPATMRSPMHHLPSYGPPPQPSNLQAYPPAYSQPPASYSQPSAAWSPSPVTTPTSYGPAHYSHPLPHPQYQHAQHPQHPQHSQHPQHPQHSQHPQHPQHYHHPTLPPPQQHHAQPPSLTYSHGSVHHQYDRLPPPQQPTPSQHQQRIPSPRSALAAPLLPLTTADVPTPQQLQATARQAANMIDPELASRPRSGPLPALGQQPQITPSTTVSHPPQTRSTSPPRSKTPEGNGADGPSAGNSKVTVNSLLHPDSALPESGSSNSGVNGGNPSPKAPSPRTPSSSRGSVNGSSSRSGREMDARAIGALDKNICVK